MGCDWMSCDNCGESFNWTYCKSDDYCKKCKSNDRFICLRCDHCCKCCRGTNDDKIEDCICKNCSCQEMRCLNELKVLRKCKPCESCIGLQNNLSLLEMIDQHEKFIFFIKKVLKDRMG
jgi:hypothetical protein